MPLRRALVRRMRSKGNHVCQAPQLSTPLASAVSAPPSTISAPPPPIKPSPGHDSPSHAQALRPEHGLQKYSTSKFDIRGPASQHFSGAALKLYTHGQVQGGSSQGIIQTLIKTFGSLSEVRLLAASDPFHAFGSLAKVALHILEVAQNSRDTFVQVFSHPSAPPGVSRRASRRTAPTLGWSIQCTLAQSSDGLRSKPWIMLQTNQMQVNMPVSGQKSTARARNAESTVFIHWTASGELKPDALSDRAPHLAQVKTLAKGSVFQAIAEDAAFAIFDVAKQPGSWTSFDTLSFTIRDKLLMHLRLSTLPTVLDMRQLELTVAVKGPLGRRYVQNIRLNPDGTVRTSGDVAETSELKMLPVLESHSAIEPADEGPKMPVTLKVDSAKGGDSGHMIAEGWRNDENIKTLSREAVAKVGVHTLWSVGILKHATSDVESAFAAFDSACRNSDAKGFACLAGAATASLLLRSASIPLQGNGTDGRAYSIRLNSSRGRPRIMVELPRVYPSALALALKLTSPDASPVQVTLSTQPIIHQGNGPAPGVNLPLLVPDEVTLLTNAAELVIDRVSSATTFDSAASAASTLAEALLRFVAFRSSTVQLVAVLVDIAPSQEHGASATASWQGDHLGVKTCDGYAQVSIEELPSPEARGTTYKSRLQYAEDQEADPPTSGDKVATVPFRVIEPDGEMSLDRDTTSHDNKVAGSVERYQSHTAEVAESGYDATSQEQGHKFSNEPNMQTSIEDCKADYHLRRVREDSVQSRITIEESIKGILDCRSVGLLATWDLNRAPTTEGLEVADLHRTAHEEISRLGTFSFAKWHHVASRISASLQDVPVVALTLVADSKKYMRNLQAQNSLELQLKSDCSSRSANVRVRVLRHLRQHRDQQRILRISVKQLYPSTAAFVAGDRGDALLMKFWEAAFADVIQPVIANGDLSDLVSLQAETYSKLTKYILANKLFSSEYRLVLRLKWVKDGSEDQQEHLSEELGLEEEQHEDPLGEQQQDSCGELNSEHQHPQDDLADHQDSPGHARPFEELDTSFAAHSHVPTYNATSTAAHEESWDSEKHDAQTEETDDSHAEYHLRSTTSDMVKSRLELGQILDGAEVVAGVSWKSSEPPSTDQLGFADLREMVEKELCCVRPFTFNSLGHALRRLGEVLPSEPIVEVVLMPLLKKAFGSGTNSDPSRLDMKFRFSDTLPGRVTVEMRGIVRSQRGAQRGKTRITIETAGLSLSPDIMSDAHGIEKLTNFWDLAFENVIRPIATATDCKSSRGRTALRTKGRLGLEKYINTSVLNEVRCTRISARWNPDDTSQEHRKIAEDEGRKKPRWRRNVFLALGSNVGDRFRNIEDACDKLDDAQDIRIIDTSPLYETEPMYVEEQDRFLNGVCQIETTLAPMDLLDRLQAIENDLGRVKFIDKGPRNIDLDIIAYDQEIINNERLIVPHLLMTEREFVLRPLCK
ncbi:hypothetical protein TI39_contig5894g00005 [Zymoseptoria brevis]|uniref:2-amino-4-hydroxy-6-hydroxymethyldihydropteridine diphosphokinase n=1 Tax=Zymoseptoria brevis TaxID=1047168 RepID=A0A0F4G4C8_9PEZI|nr:hypothetical protein TI39_contig5894g00005 [Zymoseptoria brevis]